MNHPGLAKALRFIAGHFAENINMVRVARNAGMSRRSLYQAFIDHLDCDPAFAGTWHLVWREA